MDRPEVLLNLRRFVQGPDWHRLCSTCTTLWNYRSWNARFRVSLTDEQLLKIKSNKVDLPLGVTSVLVNPKTKHEVPVFSDTVRIVNVVDYPSTAFMKWTLPSKLLHLDLGRIKIETLDIILPDTLEVFRARYVGYTGVLPKGLRKLAISGKNGLPQFPKTLISLEIADYKNPHTKLVLPHTLRWFALDGCYSNFNWELPDSLTSLVIINTGTVMVPIPLRLPSHLTYLNLSGNLSKPKDFRFPEGLQRLHLSIPLIGGLQPDPGFFESWTFPESLKELRFCTDFDHPVIIESKQFVLPSRLEVLAMGWSFDHPVVGWKLPETLRVLDLGFWFNQPLEGWKLPRSLTYLHVGTEFSHPIADLDIPPTLKKLCLPSAWKESNPHSIPTGSFQVYYSMWEAEE